MNPSEGRVPVSWNECADWQDAGGVVLLVHEGGATEPAMTTAAEFRTSDFMAWARFDYYRLLPPPGLVAAPEGMDGGGWLGEGRHVPEGWPWRHLTKGPWNVSGRQLFDDAVLQCRPPVRARDVVEVPLTRLVGRTIEGCEDAVTGYRTGCLGVEWLNSRGGWFSFPAGSLDLDTGLVRVYAEGDEK